MTDELTNKETLVIEDITMGINGQNKSDDTHLLKWRRTYRRYLSEINYALEHEDEFKSEFDFMQHIKYKQRKAHEALNEWHSDKAEWERTRTEMKLPEPIPQDLDE
tara:strand:+ start:537 stop:854 length:318 start_codon:yes stop_codon:yes gene_type:complete